VIDVPFMIHSKPSAAEHLHVLELAANRAALMTGVDAGAAAADQNCISCADSRIVLQASLYLTVMSAFFNFSSFSLRWGRSV